MGSGEFISRATAVGLDPPVSFFTAPFPAAHVVLGAGGARWVTYRGEGISGGSSNGGSSFGLGRGLDSGEGAHRSENGNNGQEREGTDADHGVYRILEEISRSEGEEL